MKYHFSIRDFGVIRSAEFRSDNGVLVLHGDNGSGKTTVSRALACLFSGVGRRIRTGASDFRIAFAADFDGTGVKTVIRTFRTYSVYDGDVVDGVPKGVPAIMTFNKVGNTLPTELRTLFGFAADRDPIDPILKTMLGFRSDLDPLVFSQTSAGDSYKVLSHALGVDGLKDASAGGVLESTRINRKLSSLNDEIKVLESQLAEQDRILTDLDNFSNSIDGNLINVVGDLESALAVLPTLSVGVDDIPQDVDMGLIGVLNSITDGINRLTELGGKDLALDVPDVIDASVVSLVESISAGLSKLSTYGAVEDIPVYDALAVGEAICNMGALLEDFKTKVDALAETEEKLNGFKQVAASQGLKMCPVCSAVYVE